MSPARVAALAAAAVLGAVVALAGLLVHRAYVPLGAVPVPWGLLLGLLTAYAVVAAAGSLAGSAAAAAAAAGWGLGLLATLQGRSEGDFLLAADVLGHGFTWGGMVTVAVALVRSVGSRSRPTLAE